MADPINSLPKGHMMDEYEVVRVLGMGGFGTTYLCFDTHLDKAVAIKEYMPRDLSVRLPDQSVKPNAEGDSDDFDWGLERIMDEARALGRFDHKNIVKVHRYFKAHGTAYIVMEYAEGQTLSEVFSAEKPLKYSELRAILDPVLEGLGQVHASKFLHRDIKPGNVIMRENGTPVLIDFGAARQAIGAMSRSVTAIVSPGYAPIEQYSTKGVQGPWTDIYAIAGICYKAITTERPDDATERVLGDELVPLTERKIAKKLGYPVSFLAAIDNALSIHKDERPQSIDAWRKNLYGGAVAAAAKADAGKKAPVKPSKLKPAKVKPTAPVDEPKGRGGLIGTIGLLALAGTAAGVYFFAGIDGFSPSKPEVFVYEEEVAPEIDPAELAALTAADDAAYDAISSTGRVSAFGGYVRSFPSGAHLQQADKGAWNAAKRQNSTAAYNAYLDYFPQGEYVANANEKLETLQNAPVDPSASQVEPAEQPSGDYVDPAPEPQSTLDAFVSRENNDEAPEVPTVTIYSDPADETAWENAMEIYTLPVFKAYIADFPQGAHLEAANSQIYVLELAEREAFDAGQAVITQRDNEAWQAALDANAKDGYESYLNAFSGGIHRREAEQKIADFASTANDDAKNAAIKKAKDDAAWKDAARHNSREAYNTYLKAKPDGRHRSTALLRLNLIKKSETSMIGGCETLVAGNAEALTACKCVVGGIADVSSPEFLEVFAPIYAGAKDAETFGTQMGKFASEVNDPANTAMFKYKADFSRVEKIESSSDCE